MEIIESDIKKLGNPSKLLEMLNLCIEMRKIIARIDDKVLPILSKEFLSSDVSLEKLKEVCSFYEKELPELDNLSAKALEIVGRADENARMNIIKVNGRYGRISITLINELKNNILSALVYGESFKATTEYVEVSHDSENKSKAFMMRTLGKIYTAPKAE